MSAIHRRIAIRKFVAVPLTIASATTGSVIAAYYAEIQLLNSNDSYLFSIFFGLLISIILSLGMKSLLKLRGTFKLDYILVSLVAVTLAVSALSFLFHVIVLSIAYS